MRKKRATKQEITFLAVSLAASALILALAFLDAAPLRPADAEETGSTYTADTMLDAAQVDLNTAGLEALCTLPGIGEKKAQAILDDRAANGPYERVEDVTRVSGITQNTIRNWTQIAYVSRQAG